MTAPKLSEIRAISDDIIRAVGVVLRDFAFVEDWAHTKDRGQAGAAEDAKAEGKTVTPSRRPAWEQDSTGDVVLNKAKSRARGNLRRAAEKARDALDDLRSAEALLRDAVKDPTYDRFRDEQRMARMNVGRVPPTEMAELQAAQRRREERGDGAA